MWTQNSKKRVKKELWDVNSEFKKRVKKQLWDVNSEFQEKSKKRIVRCELRIPRKE